MTKKGDAQHKMILFNKNNVLDPKIDRLTSMITILSVQNRQTKPCKPRAYQDRGRPLKNSGKDIKYYNSINRNRSNDRN